MSGILGAAVRRPPRREEHVRAAPRRADDTIVLDPSPGQESHLIARAARADALVAVDAGDGEVPAGEGIRYIPI